MSEIRNHFNQVDLDAIALPSNIKYGTAIYERNAVSISQENDTEIEVFVGGITGTAIEGGGSKRRVRFWLDAGKLTWRCAGNPKNHEIFCKHCVAAALYIRDVSRK